MASAARINANRRNALKSTGPRTPAGKQAVRLNALWHGALAVDPLLPGEDPAAFSQFRERFRRMYQPVSQAEEILVDRIVLACWRLQRLASMQGVVLCALDSPRSSGPSFIRSLKRFVLGQAEPPEPDPEEAGAPDALTCACITLGKLARYESAYENSFYRALHELELLRADALSPPLTADS
jgi:hypothetical protein